MMKILIIPIYKLELFEILFEIKIQSEIGIFWNFISNFDSNPNSFDPKSGTFGN